MTVVSAQTTLAAKTAPVTIPGTGLKKGQRLPSGARIVYREVTLEDRQSTRLTLRAPAGKTLRGLAPAGDVAFAVIDRRNYVGRRKVSVRAYKNPNVGGEVSGQIYGLAR